MRRFRDTDGAAWDVVLGRESWGTFVALFVPVGDGDVRQTVLRGDSTEAAQQEIDTVDEAALRTLLRASTQKDG